MMPHFFFLFIYLFILHAVFSSCYNSETQLHFLRFDDMQWVQLLSLNLF